MSQDLFNTDDIFDDKKSRADFTGAIGFIIRAMLAVTTAGFFFQYVGNLYNWVAGDSVYGPYLSAITGVFMIDALAYFWTKLRQQNGNSKTQITAATIGTIGNMALSIVVTAVFIILQTAFVEIRDAAGNLNSLGNVVNTAGFIVATAAFVFNGALWAYYDANSFQAIQALRNAVLTAARAAGVFAIDDRRNRLEIGRTVQELNAALPRYTNDAAARNRTQYLLDNFKDIDRDGDGRLSDRELAAAPSGPETFTIHRKIPGRTDRQIKDGISDYRQAEKYVDQDSHSAAPGTRYAIKSNGHIITTFEKTGTALHAIDRQPANNGRPTRPQRFE